MITAVEIDELYYAEPTQRLQPLLPDDRCRSCRISEKCSNEKVQNVHGDTSSMRKRKQVSLVTRML